MTDANDQLPPSESLRGYWDAFLAGSGGDRPSDLDPAWSGTIERLHALDDAPAPDAAMVDRIWQESQRRAAATRSATANGRYATADLRHATTVATAGVGAGRPRWRAVARGLAVGFVREVGIAALAGFLVGLVAIGGGARLIMRLLALTADPVLQGTLTENGERVGEITFGGTLFLLLSGAVVGAAGGVVYALVKPWLPWSGWRRGLVFGLLLAMTFGSVALEGGNNPDYRRFGVPFVNVCLFNALPVVFGLLLVPVADRFGPRLRSLTAAGSGRGKAGAIAIDVLLLVFALPPVLMGIPAVFGADPIALAVVGVILSRAGIARWVGRFERPSDLLARPAAFAAAYAVLALPTLAGLYLTLRAAGRILGVG